MLSKCCFNFQFNHVSFLLFCFIIYKIVDSKYSTDDYKTARISIAAIMKNAEILRLVPDHLKAKKMCKHAAKELPFVITYVPERYKTQQMCDKAVLENGGMLESVPYQYKTQEVSDKAVDNYAHALEFAPECYNSQEMCVMCS